MAGSRRLAAIMFTDIAGFTPLTQTDEAGALRLLQEQDRLVGPILEAHRGRKVKSMGDGLLIEFPNALDAVECGVELQRRVHEHSAEEGARPLRMRVGIHLGDVQRRGTDILGDAVNIASRVEPLAEPGGVCLSAQVYDQIHNKLPYQLEKLGPQSLKGVQEPVDIYRVVLPWAVPETVAAAPALPRLAILPLASISPDPKDEYFADGLTEELTSVLSKIRGLRVIARTSVGQYKSTSEPISKIGQELGVSSILEGSVRNAGNRIRVTLQLIDVASQEHIWSESYDREVDDIFAIQTEVAGRTAGVLQVELLKSDQEALGRRPTSNLEAYLLYLQGVHALRKWEEGTLTKRVSEAIACFERAIQMDPEFSLAYSYLANTLVGGVEDLIPPREGNLRARDLADKALQLDPHSSDAHTARGNIARWLELDWAVAESEFKSAITLNPSNSTAHYCYGMLLRTLQRFEEAKAELRSAVEFEFDEARAELRSAVQFDPLDYGAKAWLAEVHCRLGEFDSALALAKRGLERAPGRRRLHLVLGWVYAASGQWDKVRTEVDLAAGSTSRWVQLCRTSLLALLGERDEAARLLRTWVEESKTRYIAPTWSAGLYSMLGDKDAALGLLERDCREGDRYLSSVYEWEFYDPIREDPRFAALLRAMNLPTAVSWHRVTLEGKPP